tara:strand:- start:1185 stop:1607 length:423 start_codon:yes stop_codon:yes gene_type:complete
MENFKGDKRTKEYKDWKAEFEAKQSTGSKGLGDTIEKITEATGIKKAVKFLAGEDCGCDARKTKLNEIFRYNQPECLTEIEYNYLSEIFRVGSTTIPSAQQMKMNTIYNRVFHQNKKTTSCGRCFMSTYNDLKTLMNQYK